MPFEDDPDHSSIEDIGQLAQLIVDLDTESAWGDFVHFVDGDGEDVFLKLTSIRMLTIPHAAIEPELLSDEEDAEEPEDDEVANIKPTQSTIIM